MPDQQSARDQLLAGALQSYRDEYKELSDTWRHVEGKAQGTITVAGIFLAAAFAFVRDLTGAGTGLLEKSILAVAVGLLTATVILAVLSLRVREVVAPPLGENLDELITDLSSVRDAEEIAERLPRFVGDQLSMWRSANEEVDRLTKSKAGLVALAQKLLLVAIGLVALLTSITIFT